jgi:hypothetical protein
MEYYWAIMKKIYAICKKMDETVDHYVEQDKLKKPMISLICTI